MNIRYPWQLTETLRTIINIAKKNKNENVAIKQA